MKVKFKFTSSPRKLSTGKLTAMVEFEAGTDRHDLLDLELSENTVMSNEEVIGEHKPDMTIDEMLSKLRSDWLGIYAIMKTICKPAGEPEHPQGFEDVHEEMMTDSLGMRED